MSITTRFNAELNTVSQAYGDAIVKAMAANLRTLGKVASGDLIKSLTVNVFQDGGKSVLRLSAKDYLRFVDKGRKPGRFPPLSAISKWASIKGISQRFVFPIARKIARDGIKKTDVVNDTIVAVEKRYNKVFDKQLEKIVGVVIVNDIFNQTNTKGKIIPSGLRL